MEELELREGMLTGVVVLPFLEFFGILCGGVLIEPIVWVLVVEVGNILKGRVGDEDTLEEEISIFLADSIRVRYAAITHRGCEG